MAAKVALPGRAYTTELIVFRVALFDDLMIRLEKSCRVIIVERVVISQTKRFTIRPIGTGFAAIFSRKIASGTTKPQNFPLTSLIKTFLNMRWIWIFKPGRIQSGRMLSDLAKRDRCNEYDEKH